MRVRRAGAAMAVALLTGAAVPCTAFAASASPSLLAAAPSSSPRMASDVAYLRSRAW